MGYFLVITEAHLIKGEKTLSHSAEWKTSGVKLIINIDRDFSALDLQK